MKTIKFDFYNANKELWLQNFCQAFSLNQKDVREFFRNSIDSDITPNNIVSIFNPNLKHYDSSSIEIICRHMTTTNDIEISNFKKVGLLDLRNVLRINSPLSQYMHQNGISIDIDNKEIQINDIKYPITLHGEPCQKCIKKLTKRCQSFEKCNLRRALDTLGLKLYEYGATLEFFIHATIEQMKRYSSISSCPEILQTLDKIVAAIRNAPNHYDLSYEWARNHPKCYMIEFPAKLSDMETYAPIDYQSAYEEYGTCIVKSGYTYDDYIYERDKIPQNVFDNMVFLRWFISIYAFDSEQLGSLLPGISAPTDKLKFIPITK